jgi:glycosyltransferase involved in cell wall biosynthesis
VRLKQDMGRRPRVLIVNENESVPGDRRVWDISTTLARAGCDVVVICPEGLGDTGAPLEHRDGVEIHRYRPSFAGNGVFGYLREYVRAFWCTWVRVRRLVREKPFDIVHACNPPDFLLFASWPARRRGARFIFDHHDLTPELFLTRFGARRRLLHHATLLLERLSFRAADVVLATNESYRDVACGRGGKQADDVFVVRNAPDLRRLKPVAADPSLKRGKQLLIGYLGVMAPQDGVDHALNALALLGRRRQDWHAVLAGEGPARQELIAMAGALGLSDMVEFPGWLGDAAIARLLSSVDVCLSPEPRTPLNNVSTMVKIGEYMAMSRPIVAYALQETCRIAGDAAAYAEPNDVAALARALDGVLDDADRRARMGASGRARIERSMTWEHSTAALFAAYGRAFRQDAPSSWAARGQRRGEALPKHPEQPLIGSTVARNGDA